MKKLVLLLAMGIVSVADAFAWKPFVSEVVAEPVMGKRMGPAIITTDPSTGVASYTIRCNPKIAEVCFIVYRGPDGSIINPGTQNGPLPANSGYVMVDFGGGQVVSGQFTAHYNAPVDGDVMLREHTLFVIPSVSPVLSAN